METWENQTAIEENVHLIAKYYPNTQSNSYYTEAKVFAQVHLRHVPLLENFL